MSQHTTKSEKLNYRAETECGNPSSVLSSSYKNKYTPIIANLQTDHVLRVSDLNKII